MLIGSFCAYSTPAQEQIFLQDLPPAVHLNPKVSEGWYYRVFAKKMVFLSKPPERVIRPEEYNAFTQPRRKRKVRS